MNIESLEINLFKVSEIKEKDIVLVKIHQDEKKQLKKEDIQNLYEKITKMVNKEIPIYFFPANLDIQILRSGLEEAQKAQESNDVENKEQS